MFKNFYKKYINKKRKKWRYKNLIKNLKNKEFSIISNNCDAGIIYNNLGLKFLTPTINLWFEDNDYILFIKNLKEFIEKGQMSEYKQSQYNYPIGKLQADCGEVKILFMHYKTFEEAKEKWNERAKRINWENLYYLFEVKPTTENKHIKEFELFNSNKKAMISFGVNKDSKLLNVIKIKGNYRNGVAVEYQSKLSPKRWIDDFDYIKFLNN